MKKRGWFIGAGVCFLLIIGCVYLGFWAATSTAWWAQATGFVAFLGGITLMALAIGFAATGADA